MRIQMVIAGMALSAICLSACGTAADATAGPPSRATLQADNPSQVLQILQDAGLCSRPQSEKAQPASETSFGHAAMTVCHDPQSPAQNTIVLMEGMQPASRDRMASQLTDEHVYAYVRKDDDPWFVLIPEAQEKATQKAFGGQLKRLPSTRP